jgi:alanine dehydrogenase
VSDLQPRTIVLSTRDIKSLLSMQECISVQESVFALNADGKALNYENAWSYADTATMAYPATGKMMSGRIEPDWWGMKVYGAREGSSDQRARMQVLLLFNSATLLPVALLEANYLGHVRTGAGAAVASKFLARSDAQTLSVLGTGATARFATQAHAAAGFSFDRVLVYSRSPESRKKFAVQMEEQTGYEITPVEDAEQLVRQADVLITGTASHKPAFDPEWVQPGTHVNAMGQRQEVPPQLFLRALNVADEVQIAIDDGKLSTGVKAGVIGPEAAHASIGDVITGKAAGRSDASQITLFDSSGLCVQDIAAGVKVVEEAMRQGLGNRVEFHHDDPLWEGE